MRQHISILTLVLCQLASINCLAQNLDLVEGFYEILEKPTDNSRKMLYRGDSSMVYYIAEHPIVSKHHRKDTEVDQDNKALYFFFDERGTERLLAYTTNHLGKQIGFVYVGSLNKIYTIEEIVDNGVIEFTAENIHKVDRHPPNRVE